jgi:NADH-quinone oxidoreductase subunit H
VSGTVWDVVILLVKVVGVFAALMLTVLFTIWLERRVVAFMQTRVGPNRVGPFGVLQSLADGIKLFFKEDVRPTNADRILYGLAPVIMMIPAFLAFSVVPFGFAFGSQRAQLTDLNVGLLFVLAGWASGSNYPLLGAVRSSAQMISYEIAQGLSLVGVFMTAGTLSAAGIVAAQQGDPLLGFIPRWYVIFQFPLFLVFLLSGIAETNRAPFDLPEAESELVGGYHTEYSGVKFALFFLAEYLNIITVSAVAATAFLGGPDGPAPDFLPWLWPILWFIVKVFFFIFLFVWLRATLPRLRFDRLMDFGWKVLIPVALAWLAVTAVVLVVDINLPRPVLLALLLLSFLLPSSERGKADRTAPGGSTP